MKDAGERVPPILLTEKVKKKQLGEKPKNAVAYIRVSTDRQVKLGHSLDEQELICTAFCEPRGLQIIKFFKEPGESARHDDRQVFQSMIDYCKKHADSIHSVVIINVSRFFRNTEEHLQYRNMLRRLRIGMLSPQMDMGDSPEQKLMETQFAAFAQYESDVKEVQARASLLATRRRGRLSQKAPIGYVNERLMDRPRGTVVRQDPIRAPIIAECFRMLAYSSRSKAAIYRWATDAGLTNPKTNNPISIQTFNRLFENCSYAGIIHVSDDEFVTAEFEPVITRELFELVQSKLTGDVTHRVPHKPEPVGRPLQGVIRCPGCGKLLSGSHRPGKAKKALYGYYHHPKHNQGCPMPGIHIPVKAAENSFIKLLEKMSIRKPFLELMERMVRDTQSEARTAVERDLQRLEEDRHQLKALQAGLRRKFALDQFSQEDYEEGMQDCDRELAELAAKEQELRRSTVPLDYFLKRAVYSLEHLDIGWQTASEQDKRKIARALFPDGITCTKAGDVGTPRDAVQFSLFNLLDMPECTLATPTGFEPVLPA